MAYGTKLAGYSCGSSVGFGRLKASPASLYILSDTYHSRRIENAPRISKAVISLGSGL